MESSTGVKRTHGEMNINNRQAPPVDHQLQTSHAVELDPSVTMSGQSEPNVHPSTPPTVRSIGHSSNQQTKRQNGDLMFTTEDIEDESTEAFEPREKLGDFDWEDLQARYHDMVKERAKIEEELNKDFSSLISYFSIWAGTVHAHEVERSFKRLKTRMHHVQHSEDLLEQKRQHYMKVVEAFQSALNLLNA